MIELVVAVVVVICVMHYFLSLFLRHFFSERAAHIARVL